MVVLLFNLYFTLVLFIIFFFFQAEDGIRDKLVTGVRRVLFRSAVYLASDLRLDREVAVKLVKGGAGDEHARRRFDREARASARLRHPNIITVHAYGSAGSDLAYLVMERLVGTTLRAEIQRRGGLEPGVVADWFDQVLQAVAFAHGAGVIHRDLKPENV